VPVRTIVGSGTFVPSAAPSETPSVTVSTATYRPHACRGPELPVGFGEGEDNAYLVLDFGRTVSGYPQVTLENASSGTVIELSYDEMLTEHGTVDPERTYAHLTDRFKLGEGTQIISMVQPRGFRYLMITVSMPGELILESVGVKEETYPFTLVNSVSFSDPRLAEYIRKSAETVRICTQDAFMDCPSRERVQWTEDMLFHARTAFFACADTRMLRHALFQAAQCQLSDGRINGFFPSERQNCAFASSSLAWLHMLADYWQHEGNDDDLQQLREPLTKLLAFLDGVTDEHRLISRWPCGQFWEWAPIHSGGDDCLLLTNAAYVLAG